MTAATSFLRGKQVVFLSSIDWDAAWQRHQVLASEFARAGAEVFFVENTGFRTPRFSDAQRVIGRLFNVLFKERSSRREHPVPAGIKLIAPMVCPPTNGVFRTLNKHWLLPSLARKLRRRGLRETDVAVAYIPSQTTIDLLALLKPRASIYDVVDHFGAHPNPPDDLKRTEAELIRGSDQIFTTSPLLQEIHAKRHARVDRIHHGVSENFFIPPPKLPKKHRRLCYFGTLREGLDYPALNALAEAGCEVTLIGPEKDSVPALDPRIERVGMVTSSELVRRLAEFDALLLPYDDSEWSMGITPAKIYECLATGLPVVSSPLPGLAAYAEHLYTAKGPKGFVAAVRRLDDEETPERAAARIDVAKAHSTRTQFEKIAERIRACSRAPTHALPEPADRLPRPVESFLRGFSWISVFFAIAKAATLLTQMAAARLLGPEGYGQANLVMAVNTVLQILPMLGFPLALSHFAPKQESDHMRRRIISTSMASFAVWSLLTLAAIHAFGDRASALAGLDKRGWGMAVMLAWLSAAHLTICAGLQGLTWFKTRGVAETLYGLGATVLMFSLYASGRQDYSLLIDSLAGGFLTASLFGLWQLRRFLAPHISRDTLRSIIPYAALGTLNVLAAALTQAPGRISAFYFDSARAAGIYSAYFTATVQVALALITMTWTVLIPIASLPEGQREAWRHLRRLLPLIALCGLILFSICGGTALTLIGGSYPLKWSWLMLFIASATVILCHSLLSALFAARDMRGLMISAAGAVTAGLGNLVLNLLWTPKWGVGGAAAALLTGYSLSLAWYLLYIPAKDPA